MSAFHASVDEPALPAPKQTFLYARFAPDFLEA